MDVAAARRERARRERPVERRRLARDGDELLAHPVAMRRQRLQQRLRVGVAGVGVERSDVRHLHDLPAIHDGHLVGDAGDDAQIVRDPDDRRAERFAQILELMRDLKREKGLSMLFITHDLGIVRKFADRVCVMTQGKIVEEGPTAELFADPQHPYTRHLLDSEPKGEPPEADPTAPVVLEGEDIRVHFPIKAGFLRKTVDVVKAVDGIDVQLREGQTLGVVGESGSGKTTLGLALTRMIKSEGRIAFVGQDIGAYSFKEMKPLRDRMQIVFQDPYGSLSPRMSIAEIVAEGLQIHQPALTYEERDERVAATLAEVGVEPSSRFRYPHEFSGGQRQRIAIARAMVLEPRFVMLDEPTSALDMSVQAQVVDLLRRLQDERDLAYLFISHDLKVVRALANEVIVMRQGQVVEQGPARQIFDAPRTDYTRALLAAAFDIEATAAGSVNQ